MRTRCSAAQDARPTGRMPAGSLRYSRMISAARALSPPPIQALRELTRTRGGLIQTRTQAQNRVTKVLEDTNIKVASVVADRFGVSGRRMRAALIAGARHPQVLADLAVRRL